jgi:hypothetical protein
MLISHALAYEREFLADMRFFSAFASEGPSTSFSCHEKNAHGTRGTQRAGQSIVGLPGLFFIRTLIARIEYVLPSEVDYGYECRERLN